MLNVWVYLGVNGSGKDFQAKLKSEELKVLPFDFSDGVREYTFAFLGWTPPNKDDYEAWKSGQSTMFMPEGLSAYSIKMRKGREFLDNVGKKMRDFDPDFWAKHTVSKATEYYQQGVENIIFSSCRYINEAKAILDFVYSAGGDDANVNFIFCDYQSTKYDDTYREYQELALILRDMGAGDLEKVNEKIYYLIANYEKVAQVFRSESDRA